MTQLATTRDTKHKSTPHLISLPMAAATKIWAGAIVCDNGSGYATEGATSTTLIAWGRAEETVDNTGDAGDLRIEVRSGLFNFVNSEGGDEITIADRGSLCYLVDDQTVAKLSTSRSIAGIVWDVDADGVWVWMGVAHALAYASLAATVNGHDTDLLSTQMMVPVPLNAFRVYADGTALVPFDDGVADGIDPTAESLGYRFNVASTAKIAASVQMPNDLDDTADVVVHIEGYRVGSADATAAITVGAFFRTVGAAFNADADAGGASTAFDAATTVVSEETLTIAAANVPASPSSLLLTLVPTAALDADDMVVLEVWIEYTRKLLTA